MAVYVRLWLAGWLTGVDDGDDEAVVVLPLQRQHHRVHHVCGRAGVQRPARRDRQDLARPSHPNKASHSIEGSRRLALT